MKILFNKTQLFLLLMLFVFASSAFSAQTNSEGQATSQNATSMNNTTIDLVAEKMAFNTSTITVPAGAHVIVNFENKDAGVRHNFAVYDSSMNVIFRGDLIAGPSKTTYSFDAPAKASTYRFQCDPHASFMNGQFIVT
jgi:plastocyanin